MHSVTTPMQTLTASVHSVTIHLQQVKIPPKSVTPSIQRVTTPIQRVTTHIQQVTIYLPRVIPSGMRPEQAFPAHAPASRHLTHELRGFVVGIAHSVVFAGSGGGSCAEDTSVRSKYGTTLPPSSAILSSSSTVIRRGLTTPILYFGDGFTILKPPTFFFAGLSFEALVLRIVRIVLPRLFSGICVWEFVLELSQLPGPGGAAELHVASRLPDA
jgi:hypothetical protein